MKTTIKLLALICALIMVISFAACGEKKDDSSKKSDESSSSEEAVESDYDWINYDMPEGYIDAKESDAYVTIEEEADSYHKIKMFKGNLYGDDTLETIVGRAIDVDPERYTRGDDVEIGGKTWTPVRFPFNGNDSVSLYTLLDDSHYAYLTIFEMTENDPAPQTVINSIEFDTSEF